MRTRLLRIAASVVAISAFGCGGGSGPPMALDAPSPYTPPQKIFTANNGTSTLAFYLARSAGDVPPQNVINGSSGVFGPSFILVDGPGNLWCSNTTPGDVSIAEYDPGALPGTPPITMLAGTKTRLGLPEGIAFDALGSLYVANGLGNDDVLVFAAGASGDVKPIATIKGKATGLNGPTGLALDAAGDIFVVNSSGTFGGSVEEFAPGANNNVAPTRTIAGPDTKLFNPRGIAFDSIGQVYVTTSSSVLVFAADSSGDSPPVRVISGSNTLLGSAGQVAIDQGGNVFVASGGKNALVEFSATAVGNTAPILVIAGPSTLLGSPSGIAIH